MMVIQHSVNSDWMFNTQSRVLQADWFILEIDEKATLNFGLSDEGCHKLNRIRSLSP